MSGTSLAVGTISDAALPSTQQRGRRMACFSPRRRESAKPEPAVRSVKLPCVSSLASQTRGGDASVLASWFCWPQHSRWAAAGRSRRGSAADGEDSAPCPRDRGYGQVRRDRRRAQPLSGCVGSGSPTVVLEAGFGADTFTWRDVQPQLGRTTRTCAYDRAGTGNSVAPPGVRDARDEIADLRQLLARARIDPPYVLVGHSYGGVLARVFAHLHPTETAGSSSSTRWAAMDDDGSSPSGRARRPLKSAVSWRPR